MSADLSTLTSHIGQLSGWAQKAETRFAELEQKNAALTAALADLKTQFEAKKASAAKRSAGSKRGGGEEKFPGTVSAYFKKNEVPRMESLPQAIQLIYAAKLTEYKNVTDESKRNKDVQAGTWKAITECVKNRERDDNHRAVGAYHDDLNRRFKEGKAAYELAHPKPVSDVPAGMPSAPTLAPAMMPNIAGLNLNVAPTFPAAPVAAPVAGLPTIPAFPTFPGSK